MMNMLVLLGSVFLIFTYVTGETNFALVPISSPGKMATTREAIVNSQKVRSIMGKYTIALLDGGAIVGRGHDKKNKIKKNQIYQGNFKYFEDQLITEKIIVVRGRGSNGNNQLCSRYSPNGRRNMQLVDKINHYRSQIGRSALQCNEALAFTAYSHTRNQNDVNPPSSGNCNLHSWFSNKFLGKGGRTCCYKEDHSYSECTWKKPEELYGYDVLNGHGYEISFWASYNLDAEDAFEDWKYSPGHNDMMAGNRGWSDLSRVGCFYYKNYANCWFAK